MNSEAVTTGESTDSLASLSRPVAALLIAALRDSSLRCSRRCAPYATGDHIKPMLLGGQIRTNTRPMIADSWIGPK